MKAWDYARTIFQSEKLRIAYIKAEIGTGKHSCLCFEDHVWLCTMYVCGLCIICMHYMNITYEPAGRDYRELQIFLYILRERLLAVGPRPFPGFAKNMLCPSPNWCPQPPPKPPQNLLRIDVPSIPK